MYLDELGQRANLNKILHTLKKVYNVRLDFDVPESELREVYESWTNRKTEILLEDAYNSYHNNPEYAQASLICEAVRIFLSEIGPARKGAKVRTKKMQKMGEDRNRKERADYYLEKISNLVNECNDRNITVPEENITEIYEMYKVAGNFIDEDIEDENIKRVISQYADLAKDPKYTAYIAYMIPLKKVEIEVNKFSNDNLSEKNIYTQILHFDNLNDAKEFAMQMKVALSGDYEVGTHIKVNESRLTETENGKEIEPEVEMGKDMHKDAGQDFDGKVRTKKMQKQSGINETTNQITTMIEHLQESMFGKKMYPDCFNDKLDSIRTQEKINAAIFKERKLGKSALLGESTILNINELRRDKMFAQLGSELTSSHSRFSKAILDIRTNSTRVKELYLEILTLLDQKAHEMSAIPGTSSMLSFISDVRTSIEDTYSKLFSSVSKDLATESIIIETSDGKEIEPEVEIGKDMHKDAGQDFDGKDQTGDYADDRDPNGDHGYDDYDYAAEEDWNADAFVITPEMGNDDDSSELKPSDTTYNEKNVVDRYESGPGPSTDGYADDRDPTKIASQDGERSVEDPIDLLAKNKATPGKETKTGLPADLETGVDADYESGNRKNGVVKNEFNQDPENTEQRDIPKDTDLQNDNNKHYNGGESKAATTTSPTKEKSKEPAKETSEESPKEPESNKPEEDTSNEDKKVEEGLNKRRHALKMIKELNRPRSFNKIVEAAERVANDTNTQLSVVVESYKTEGKNYLETFNSKIEDPIYHEAMLETLNMLTSKNLRHMLKEAQKTQDANKVLFNFLINKAKVNGLRENAVKQFTYAAHNAIMDTDLQSFRPGQPIWEKNND